MEVVSILFYLYAHQTSRQSKYELFVEFDLPGIADDFG
jgi:hypothetical protein